MHRREYGLGVGRVDRKAALFHDAEGAAEQRLRRGRTETDDDTRREQRDLGLEPGEAGAKLACARRLVQAAARPRILRPLEMFDRVGDVGVFARDAGGVERAIQELAGRADERASGLVLGVARLLADENHPRGARSLTEDALGGVLVEVAAAARLHRGPTLGERRARRDEVSGGAG